MTQQIWAHHKDEESLPFCVQTIGKNGSTRLHKWLLEYKFLNCTYEQITNSQYHKDNLTYVFIQDPVVKFIKGFAEIISNLRPAYNVGEIQGINPSDYKIIASPAAAAVLFKDILTSMSVSTIDELLFAFLKHIDMYKWDYHVKLQTSYIALISSANLDYEVLSVNDIDNFHNTVMERYTEHFKFLEYIWPDGFKSIEPERDEDNDRKLIEERISKLVYEHMDDELSCIKEFLKLDIGLWEIFNQSD
tara:strand:- start:76 stop:816 length:741 start_codon:yes stop_codon:yes gene_type:complete